MNNNLKKRLYLLALSSILLTGCGNKEVKLETDDEIVSEVEDPKLNDSITDELEENEEVVEKVVEAKEEVVEEVMEAKEEVVEEVIEDKEEVTILPSDNFNSEEELVNYFKKQKDDVEILLTLDDSKSIEEIDARVMLFVDFMTSDINVGGYNYNDLSEDSKVTIKILYFEMDQMIEEAKPNYKEILKEKSKKFKDFCLDSYEIIKEQVMTWYEEGTLKENLYEGIFGRVDDDINDAKELFKDLYGKAKEKVKNRK